MSDPLIVAEPRTTYLPPIVVDCSVLAALLFNEGERDTAAETLFGKALFAPWLIDHEMVSVGLKKMAAGMEQVARAGVSALMQIRLTRCVTDASAQMLLASDSGLSSCDAAYLQLAIELNAPLATYDRKLGEAARCVLGR
jgi:predicted nucleic acid-binding protein